MLVYQYGILPPTQNADLVDEQMLLAHRYRNTLTAIERARRACLREVMRDADVDRLDAALAEAVADVERLEAEVKQARQEKRKRAETEAQRAALRTARAHRWELVRQTREARLRARSSEDVSARCDAINARAGELRVGARGLSGVYWGTYLLIEAADRASRGMPLYRDGEPNDPAFLRWSGDGRVGVQFGYGLAADEVFGADRKVRIDPVDPAVWQTKKKVAFTTLHLRVGSDGRQPVWASFPCKMHRPFPEGAVVRSVTVERQVRGPRVSAELGPRARWVVTFTVDAPPRKTRTNDPPKAEAVAINIGWRAVPEGLRILTWRGTDGAEGKLVLDAAMLAQMQSVQDLMATRRRAFNAAIAALAAFIKASSSLPEWFRKETATLPLWKSSERLTTLCFRWQGQRFLGDDAAYAAIAAWRHHDFHLAQYEIGRRDRVQRARRELVRLLAATLARGYEVLVHDDTDLRAFQDLPATASSADVGQNETARLNRVRGSVAAARTILASAFGREGGKVVKLSARNTTRECAVCQHVEPFDAAAELVHTCSVCEATWDQDENHVQVLLRRWREIPAPVAEADGADATAKRETSLQRGKRLAREKKAARDSEAECGSAAP